MTKQQGTVKTWKNDRGFGFIKPDDGSDDVFVHYKAFGANGRRPKLGDRVSFRLVINDKGQRRAADAQFDGAQQKTPRSNRPTTASNSRRPSFLTRLMLILIAIFMVVGVLNRSQIIPAVGIFTQGELSSGDQLAQQAFQRRQSDVQMLVDGTVSQLLADDNDGSRHQKFILRLSSGQTLLISHNIDLAPRLNGLAVGDRVFVYGEYEWNDRGGVVHWTHHDPQGQHPAGYIEWQGRRFQ